MAERVSKSRAGIRVWIRAIRVHQWAKNLLVYAPAILAHHANFAEHLISSSVAFASFSMMASAGYLLNDSRDIDYDRAHSRKRERPLAAGLISSSEALVMGLLLGSLSILLGGTLGAAFFSTQAMYVILVVSYSFWFKRRVGLDVIILGALYVIRVVAGSAATRLPLSPWLLAFGIFLFTSLGFAKRTTEVAAADNNSEVSGRGYNYSDLGVLVGLGTAAAYTAVLIFALYLNSPEVRTVYARPDLLWVIAFALMAWVTRVWIRAHRGRLGDDPLVFALTDPVSVCLGLVCGATIAIAAGR